MAGIDEKFVAELREKCNIVDVVGRYCVLSRKGSNYWARCPLPGHSEKTPSFTVNEPGQFYHCFGCGKGGDVIKFIEEMENLDFIESVKYLAENVAKIPVPDNGGYDEERVKQNKNKKDRLYAVLKAAALFYVKRLSSDGAEEYRGYLEKRGVTDKTARAFGIGASCSYGELPAYLKTLGFTETEMLESGVCQKNESGNLFDAEANRLVIPVINAMNKVVAFTGRVIRQTSDKIGKYKNTKETEIYSKKRTLFAINNLKALRRDGNIPFVIIVEGNMDVISMYQSGIRNVVAPMGTALTVEQAKLLKRYTDTVYVCFDGDGAGQKATLKSLEIFESEGFEVKVLTLPDGKDPDDIARDGGKEAFDGFLKNADPLIDYKLKAIARGKDLSDVSDKRKYVAEALDFIKSVKDAFMREELLKKVRDASGITYESLKRDLESGVVDAGDEVTSDIPQFKAETNGKTAIAERFILAAYAKNKPYAKAGLLDGVYFSDPVRDGIWAALDYGEGGVFESSLYTKLGEDYAIELNAVLSAGDNVFGTNAEEKYFKDCVYALKKDNLDSEISRLNAEYAKETDVEKRRNIAALIAKKTIKLTEI